MTHPGGRPLKFKSVKELQEKIDAYFAECDPHWVEEGSWVQQRGQDRKLIYDEDGSPVQIWKIAKVKTRQIPYTITGLALALGTTRDLLIDYEEKDGFSDTIKEAKIKCHNFAELNLFGANATGPIFNLKNNYGWKDKSEVDGEQKLIIETRKASRDRKND